MKKLLDMLIPAVTLLPAFSCTEDISVDKITAGVGTVVRFTLDGAATKTEFGSPAGSVYPVLWTENQRVGIFYNSQTGSPDDNYGGQYVLPVPASDSLTAAFEATLQVKAEALMFSTA